MSIAVIMAVLFGGLIWVTVTSSRAMARNIERQRGRSIDQDMVEARLYRIEEAIDAMAVQIERLTEQQYALLQAPRSPSALHDDPTRMERPR